MRSVSKSVSWVIVASLVTVLGGVLIFSNPAEAQSQGNNAVYNSNGICSSSTLCGFSGAFIDASVFVSQANNFCGVLNYVLKTVDQPPNYPSGAVIDARGLNSTTTSMQCASSPWAGITNPPPSTILLPAGCPAPCVLSQGAGGVDCSL